MDIDFALLHLNANMGRGRKGVPTRRKRTNAEAKVGDNMTLNGINKEM